MLNTLFRYPRVLLRHAGSPLAEERSAYLSHLALREAAHSTLLRYARQLRVIALVLGKPGRDPVTREKIVLGAQRWARRQRRRGRAQSWKWPVAHFVQVACAWYRFMRWFKEESPPSAAYSAQLEAWASLMRAEEGLAESTIANCRWWAQRFLQWLQSQGASWHALTLVRVDQFLKDLSDQGMSRVSLATAVKALRRFVRYGYQRGWCQRDWSPAILSPHLFRHETLPAGPVWSEVQRLLAATEGGTHRDVRNRTILLLLAVYGLRSGEVRALRLTDVDWTRRILRVQRSKTARVQEYPLTATMAQTLACYLR